ncbi:MAG TPA: hypothetical protein VJN70_12580 [Gemmatimonadaceae bacterium]|nr:hypothetical protein [Gemmatimonadaceae bacterium]
MHEPPPEPLPPLPLTGDGRMTKRIVAGRTITESLDELGISPDRLPEMWEGALRVMAQSETSDAMIFATLMTGRMVTADNRKWLTPEQRREWNEAVAHFRIEREEGVPASDLIAAAYRNEVSLLSPEQEEELRQFAGQLLEKAEKRERLKRLKEQ